MLIVAFVSVWDHLPFSHQICRHAVDVSESLFNAKIIIFSLSNVLGEDSCRNQKS